MYMVDVNASFITKNLRTFVDKVNFTRYTSITVPKTCVCSPTCRPINYVIKISLKQRCTCYLHVCEYLILIYTVSVKIVAYPMFASDTV